MIIDKQKILDSISDPFVHFSIALCDRNGKKLLSIPMSLTKAQKKQFDIYWRKAGCRCRNEYVPMPKFFEKALLATGHFFKE